MNRGESLYFCASGDAEEHLAEQTVKQLHFVRQNAQNANVFVTHNNGI